MMQQEMETLYKEHAKSVYRYLFSLSHDSDIAEELTQETFYRALHSLHRYNGSCKPVVWLCQIAKHIWYQELEKKKKNRTMQLSEDIPSRQVSPEERVVQVEDKISLYRKIRALPEPMRDVVYMRLTEEFSFAEIGEVLGKNENWARVTFYRAKQKILEV